MQSDSEYDIKFTIEDITKLAKLGLLLLLIDGLDEFRFPTKLSDIVKLKILIKEALEDESLKL